MAGDTVSVARDIITMTEEKVGIGQKTRSVWQLLSYIAQRWQWTRTVSVGGDTITMAENPISMAMNTIGGEEERGREHNLLLCGH